LGLLPVALPDRVHALIGLALGLLLVFRTNSSYDRFWEARRRWGDIINESRNLARAASVYLAEAPDLLRSLLGWTILFPYTAQNRLRGQEPLAPGSALLPDGDVHAVCGEGNVPLAVSRRMTEQLAVARRQGLISDHVLVALDGHVQRLIDALGACERIHRTPLPFAYMVHLRRALIVYCFTLPFALVEPYGWSTVLATLFVAYTLYGIEEIGVQIEDPFGADDNDLPLERFCGTIEKDLLALVPTEHVLAAEKMTR
jgi:putative membrane protein